MRIAKPFVVLVTVIALLVSATGDADGRRCKRKKRRCRAPRPPAPAPVAPSPAPVILSGAGVPVITDEPTLSKLVIPSQGVRRIRDANLVIEGLSAEIADNFAASLRKTDGPSSLLVAGVGGPGSVNDVSITLDDEASASLPDDDGLVRGTFKPTVTDSGPLPGLSRFDGLDPAGEWILELSAGPTDVASIEGWKLVLAFEDGAGTPPPPPPPAGPPVVPVVPTAPVTKTFSAPVGALESGSSKEIRLAVPDQGEGRITSLTVDLIGLRHAHPDDLDISLVYGDSPRVLLMSDVGGSEDVDGVSLTFSDGASFGLPDESRLFSGTYRPTRGTPSTSTAEPLTFSTFAGLDPSEDWTLVVTDDTVADAGGSSIERWALNITFA